MRLDQFGEMGQDLRIDRISLCQSASGTRKVANVARIDRGRAAAYRASTSAGVLLCQGVPATQSRSWMRVSSLGPTPTEISLDVCCGIVEAESVRQGRWPRCTRSETSTNTSTLPRRVISLARFPSATPRLWAIIVGIYEDPFFPKLPVSSMSSL